MKKAIFLTLILSVFYLISKYGYYEYLEDATPEKIFFEKKYFTLQVRFDNIFANQSDERGIEVLTLSQREKVINYCKYRLGVITQLDTQEELEHCKYGYTPLHFRKKFQEK